MNLIHFLIDYIKGLNPAKEWSSSSREGRDKTWRGRPFDPILANKIIAGVRVTKISGKLYGKKVHLETSANLVWKKQSNGAWELKIK